MKRVSCEQETLLLTAQNSCLLWVKSVFIKQTIGGSIEDDGRGGEVSEPKQTDTEGSAQHYAPIPRHVCIKAGI